MKTTPTSPKQDNARLGDIIKLGVDVHIEKYVVVMKIDSSSPERPRRITPEQFLDWVAQLASKRPVSRLLGAGVERRYDRAGSLTSASG